MSADIIKESQTKEDHLNGNSKVEVIVAAKSDKTLTKNIDSKDDSLRKRTSLIIVPQKDSPSDTEDQKTITHNMSSSTIDTENCNELITDAKQSSLSKSFDSSICSNHSSTDEEDLNEHKSSPTKAGKINNKNRNSLVSVDSCVSRSNTSASSSSSTSSECTSSGDDVVLDDYHDLENGNVSIDDLEAERKNCISNSSSCIDDYSLREKLHNYVNASSKQQQDSSVGGEEEEDREAGGTGSSTDIDDGNIEPDEIDSQPCSLPLQCDALLSPQEAPMGRRYAEVAQFKGNKR